MADHRKIAALAAGFLFAQSCSSMDIGNTLFSGICVASQASCLKSCRGDYKDAENRWAYESCRQTCQPSANSCD